MLIMRMNHQSHHLQLEILTRGMLLFQPPLCRTLSSIPYRRHPSSALSPKNYQNLTGCILENAARMNNLIEPIGSHEGHLQ